MASKKKNTVRELAEALSDMETKNNIPEEMVIEALRVAIQSAYSKTAFDDEVDCRVDINVEKGLVQIFWIRNVVDHLEHSFDWTLDIPLEEARKLDKKVQIGDKFETLVPLETLKRTVIQRIKSNFTQQIKETAKKLVYDKYKSKEGSIITGQVERVEEGKYVLLTLGKAYGYMPYKETIPGETYKIGDTIKVYIKEVNMDSKKESIILSRSDARFLFKLFESEIVEIGNGDVYIRNIARIPGVRSKIVVSSKIPGLDPAGTCIGKSGTRISKIVEQLNNGQEKIDVIEYYDDPLMTVKVALSPAIVEGIGVRSEKMTMQVYNKETQQKEEKTFFGRVADVVVSNETFTLAIGIKGQNAFLAKKLSKFDKLNIIRVDDALGKVEYKRMSDIELDYASCHNDKYQPVKPTIIEEKDGDIIDNTYIEETPVVSEEIKVETVKVEPTPATYKSENVSVGPHISVVEEKPEEKVEVKPVEEPVGPSKKSVKKEEEAKAKAIEEENKKKGMAIYTDEELAEFEDEEVEDNEEEEIDYEDYDDFYDQY